MKTCWLPINIDQKGNYLASPGGRYAALIAVDTVATMDKVVDALQKQQFQVTYSWHSGQPVRHQYLMDRWLASLPAPASGRTWMYFELTYVGDMPKTIVPHIQKCLIDFGPVHSLCGTADIAYVFSAQQVDDSYHPCGPGDPQKTPDASPPAAAGCPDCPTYPPCPDLPPPCPGCPPPSFPWKPVLAGMALGASAAGGVVWWWRH
jgi:hypothetical protein